MVLSSLMAPGLLQGAYYAQYSQKGYILKNGYPLFIEVHNKGSWRRILVTMTAIFSQGVCGMSGPLIQLICVRNQEKQSV